MTVSASKPIPIFAPVLNPACCELSDERAKLGGGWLLLEAVVSVVGALGLLVVLLEDEVEERLLVELSEEVVVVSELTLVVDEVIEVTLEEVVEVVVVVGQARL